MNDDDFASTVHEWGRSKRLTPSRVRSLSWSIRHRRLASLNFQTNPSVFWPQVSDSTGFLAPAEQ